MVCVEHKECYSLILLIVTIWIIGGIGYKLSILSLLLVFAITIRVNFIFTKTIISVN